MVENIEDKKAIRLDVAKWVNEAWEKISSQTITNTWPSIGFEITNS